MIFVLQPKFNDTVGHIWPAGQSLTPVAYRTVLMPEGLKTDQDTDDLWALVLSQQQCFLGRRHWGVFNRLPTFPIYFWKGKNAEDVFVNLTWKCFFFSTSCFHRPFVGSDCAGCHYFPPSLLGGAAVWWSGRKAFFDFRIISCSVQSNPPDFPSAPVLICCPNFCLHLRRKTRVYWDAAKGKMAYLQLLDETGNGSPDAGVSGWCCRRRHESPLKCGVVSLIKAQHNHRELKPLPPFPQSRKQQQIHKRALGELC